MYFCYLQRISCNSLYLQNHRVPKKLLVKRLLTETAFVLYCRLERVMVPLTQVFLHRVSPTNGFAGFLSLEKNLENLFRKKTLSLEEFLDIYSEKLPKIVKN